MRLMLAVDLDHSRSEQLINEAVFWARSTGAALDLAFVGTGAWALGAAADPEVKKLIEREASRARESEQATLEKLMQELVPAEVRGRCIVLEGPAVSALVDASENHRALLVGTHGRSGLSRFWLGSISEQLVRRAKCPVLVLRLYDADDD